MNIKIPAVVWVLGDRVQVTMGSVTTSVRPLFYNPDGRPEATRVGTIDPDYAEALMDALTVNGEPK